MLDAPRPPADAGTLLPEARRLMAEVFGFAEFRPGQEEVVAAVLAGEDVLAVMPTGRGKSLCYQLPALVTGGLTLVVSPLVALMRDQVLALRALGVPAASLTSANAAEDERAALRDARSGSLRLLYMAPERLAMPGTLAMLEEVGVARVAVDEAHCVSEWGHDFRPEYRLIGEARARLNAPLAAFTATADQATRDDVAGRLFPEPPRLFVQGFDRPNLRLAMAAKTDRTRQVMAFVKAHKGESGIVYCSSRKRTEELAVSMRAAGLDAVSYHAGMPASERAGAQDRFQREDGVVVAATVAFGMGIDKPDVRFVAHADMPKSVESYYQEIGRAGRDGLPADTLTLYGLEDIKLRRRQIDEGEAGDARKRVEHQRLNALLALMEAPRCRRQTLLAYFGDETGPCDNCDLCAGGATTFDGTLEARKALSAVARTGERFGAEHLVSVLVGEGTDNVRRFGHDRLPTFGVGSDRDKGFWRSVVRQLYAGGCLGLDVAGHGGFALTPRGRDVLFGREAIELRADALAPKGGGARAERGPRKARRGEPVAGVAGMDMGLLGRLKAVRATLAREGNVPAYVVFPDRTLIEMAASRPASLAALAKVHGVGAAKLERYGEAFLEALAEG